MSNHQKRLSVPSGWPVERKTETFTVKAGAGPHGEDGVPLLILLRDVLGYADSRKEARYALDEDNVVVNGTAASDEERPVGMFDILTFREREEHYRVFPDEGGRLALTPIDEDAAQSKLGKIIRKQNVAGGDVQLTLHDGQTLLVDDDAYSVDDSIVVANEDDEIVAHFEYEEGALATAVDGKHAGQIGTITEIQVTPGSSDNNVLLDAHDDGERFETVEDYIVVIDENFIDDETAAEDEPEDEEVEDEPEEEEADDESEDEEADDESEDEEPAEPDIEETEDENEEEAADDEEDESEADDEEPAEETAGDEDEEIEETADETEEESAGRKRNEHGHGVSRDARATHREGRRPHGRRSGWPRTRAGRRDSRRNHGTTARSDDGDDDGAGVWHPRG
jgi:small subunit ribosomal protein S4e